MVNIHGKRHQLCTIPIVIFTSVYLIITGVLNFNILQMRPRPIILSRKSLEWILPKMMEVI